MARWASNEQDWRWAMLYYLGILLIPLFLVIALGWMFFSGRREKSDETGRIQAQAPHTEPPRAEGREP